MRSAKQFAALVARADEQAELIKWAYNIGRDDERVAAAARVRALASQPMETIVPNTGPDVIERGTAINAVLDAQA